MCLSDAQQKHVFTSHSNELQIQFDALPTLQQEALTPQLEPILLKYEGTERKLHATQYG